MLTIAYLANLYPCDVEPYVGAEIRELRRRGITVLAGSMRRPDHPPPDTIYVTPMSCGVAVRAVWLCLKRFGRINDLLRRIALDGGETLTQRAKALAHTWLGACYALALEKHRVQHIHVHHGYFASWVGMVAARLTGAGFSMTLHGSDLLLHGVYLDTKVANCKLCVSVSEFNRQYILKQCPAVEPDKVVVARLGVPVPSDGREEKPEQRVDRAVRILCIGRLRLVKNHSFLISACRVLGERGMALECRIAGEGPERSRLEEQTRRSGVADSVTLLGHVPHANLDPLYAWADVVVLTSHSEGIPLVLMEAMARRKIVIAPAITGIPELVTDGETGFLYVPGSIESFVKRVEFVRSGLLGLGTLGYNEGQPTPAGQRLDCIRHAARVHVRLNFEQQANLHYFADLLENATTSPERLRHEDSLLQQVQLPIQRNRGLSVRSDGTAAFPGS